MERAAIAERAAELSGRPARLIGVEELDYAWGSPATAGLWTVTTPDPRSGPAEYFVKLLRHPRLWPGLAQVPPQFRDEFLSGFPWTFEYDMHRSGIAAVLPGGMRTPTLHQVQTPAADHLLLWWERIHERPAAWTDRDYVRAAYLLGRLAARRRAGAAVNNTLPAVCHQTGSALRYLVQGRVLNGARPELAGHGLWSDPDVAGAVSALGEASLRTELLALADRFPALLDAVEQLPATFAHGDASPQNLLLDQSDPDTFVVIDWGLGTLLPVGFDLGQLLIGPVHAGLVDPEQIDHLDRAILPPYLEGLARDGFELPPDQVRTGYHLSLLLRSGLTALSRVELATLAPGRRPEFAERRVRLTRRLIELTADSVPESLRPAVVRSRPGRTGS